MSNCSTLRCVVRSLSQPLKAEGTPPRLWQPPKDARLRKLLQCVTVRLHGGFVGGVAEDAADGVEEGEDGGGFFAFAPRGVDLNFGLRFV
jgi:hypothetical protein